LLLENDPDQLGNCDGLPVEDRNVANIAVMTNDLDRIDRVASAYNVPADEILLAPVQFGVNMTDVMRYTNAVEVKRGLDYNRSQTGAECLLFLYKPLEFGGQGRAAIAIGDPDSADHTAVLVPGAGNSVADGWLADNDDAINLYTETVAATGQSRGVSVLAWMGYDAPDAIVDPRVTQTALARRGGAVLAADVDALKVTHRGPSHVTVVGHSYGSTTVADAAAGYGLDADDVVLVGSPGTDLARTASDFHLPAGGHVYIGAASTDPVTNLAGIPVPLPDAGLAPGPIGLGADPAADGFGSTRFKAEVQGWTLGSWTDHERYFDNGSESLFSIADVTSGHGTDLQSHGMTAPHRDSLLGPLAPRLGLPDWSIPLLDPELTRPATAGHHQPIIGGR
jgi:pimeloyl-ACP methyl ester carboxylesterase